MKRHVNPALLRVLRALNREKIMYPAFVILYFHPELIILLFFYSNQISQLAANALYLQNIRSFYLLIVHYRIVQCFVRIRTFIFILSPPGAFRYSGKKKDDNQSSCYFANSPEEQSKLMNIMMSNMYTGRARCLKIRSIHS